MSNVRTAFNACGYLTYCDETLVSLGHRIAVINNYAGVHNLPDEKSSVDSSFNLGKKGKGSPIPSKDIQDTAEESDDETSEQPEQYLDPPVVMNNVTYRIIYN